MIMRDFLGALRRACRSFDVAALTTVHHSGSTNTASAATQSSSPRNRNFNLALAELLPILQLLAITFHATDLRQAFLTNR